MARRLGEDLEAAIAQVDLALLTGSDELDELDPRDRGWTALASARLARLNCPEREVGGIVERRTVTPTLKGILASGVTEATFSATSPVDGKEKLNAFRRVRGTHPYLLVATPAESYLGRPVEPVLELTL